MHTFAHKSKAIQKSGSGNSANVQMLYGQSRGVKSILHLPHEMANQAAPHLPQTNSITSVSPHSAHDLSRASICLKGAQPKLMVNAPGDAYEQEADRVADSVVGPGSAPCGLAASSPATEDAGSTQRLGPSEQRFFGSRMGHDFSRVKVHTHADATRMTQHLGARAFAHGHDLYFAPGQYNPHSHEGRRLLAHELTHVVQQNGRHGLIQRAPPTAAEKAEKLEKLKSALISKYALSGVDDGSAVWTSSDLQQVTDAFKLIPARDKKALKGVMLTRVSTLGGKTAGQFGTSQSVTDTAVVNSATLELANLTFKDGAPASYAVIVHEVGHAVASLPSRTSVHAKHVAIADHNRLLGISNPAVDAFNKAVDEFNETVKPLNLASKDGSSPDRVGQLPYFG
ncbi:MAG: DUF4157 domain-containing protein [Candidatus Polarisedimenticolaceae bacterium]|nr:DUF4157 domain-containing protein [Candidatus Polarisedimenticolaceae bacterium]